MSEETYKARVGSSGTVEYFHKGDWKQTVLVIDPVTGNQPDVVMADARKAPLENEIREECMLLADFLVEKNRAYGNSASEPCRIFAKRVDPLAQIDVRIDDKLNRIAKGREYPQDDTIIDLAGYLILRRIVAAKQKKDGEA